MNSDPENANLFSFDWTRAFAILSLDVSTRFYRPMGLIISDQTAFRMSLRSLIVSHESVFDQRADNPDRMAEEWEMLSEQLSILKRQQGEQTRAQFFRWATTTYYSTAKAGRPWDDYISVLRRWAVQLEGNGTDTLGLEHADLVHSEYRIHTNMADIKEQIRQARTDPLSEWDRYLYDICLFSNDAEEVERVNELMDIDWDRQVYEMGLMDENGDLLESARDSKLPPYILLTDPLAYIFSTCELHRFQRFWQMLMTLLPSGSVERLYAAAKRSWSEALHPTALSQMLDDSWSPLGERGEP